MKTITGFSLVELMIATLLGAFILIGMLEVYFSVSTVLRTQQALAFIQENGRFAMHILNQQVRIAGYLSCDEKYDLTLKDKKIQRYQRNEFPSYLHGQIMNNTDVLVIWQCRMIDQQEQFVEVAYFIAETKRLNREGKPILALFEKPMGSPRRELVTAAENMRVQYIERDLKIRALAIELLLSSEENVFSEAKTYDFNGVIYHDKHMRKSWHTYIALRE